MVPKQKGVGQEAKGERGRVPPCTHFHCNRDRPADINQALLWNRELLSMPSCKRCLPPGPIAHTAFPRDQLRTTLLATSSVGGSRSNSGCLTTGNHWKHKKSPFLVLAIIDMYISLPRMPGNSADHPIVNRWLHLSDRGATPFCIVPVSSKL